MVDARVCRIPESEEDFEDVLASFCISDGESIDINRLAPHN
jgi:hypothetical protein